MSAAVPTLAAQGRRRRLSLGLVWLLLPLWILIAPNAYVMSLGIMFFINLLLIASLNLVMGYAGQISLCHGAFFGGGAYVSGVLALKLGWSPWLSAPMAMVVMGLVALVIGIPTLRLRGHYLAMGTLGFNAIVTVILVEWIAVTGGPNGLFGLDELSLFGFSLGSAERYFWVAWAAAGITMWTIARLVGSPSGRALRVVAASELAAGALGIDAFRMKLSVFVLSAAIAALAGTLYVHFNLFASPETFSFFTSVLLVVMVALGGWGSYWGPVVGALVFTAMPEVLRDFHDAELLLFGVCMLVVLLFAPRGLAGVGSALCVRLRRGSGTAPAAPAVASKEREA
jgi:branched-chain amino acid transport system permease protein